MKQGSFARAGLAAALFMALVSGAAFAQSGGIVSAGVWSLLREAEHRFDSGDTSGAFLVVEEARRAHAEEISAMAATLRQAAQAMSERDMRRAGDRISEFYEILASRGDTDATRAIDRALVRRGEAFFGNSFEALLSWLESATPLPEADMFIGDAYGNDGEADMAISFYERAWERREFFDVPGDKVALAYKMADIAAFSGNVGAQENYLLLALADDPLFARRAMRARPSSR